MINEGEQFGAWVVQKELSTQKYRCVCTICGTIHVVRKNDLVRNKTRMCRSCSAQASKVSHGMSNTPEYTTWVHMNQRCHNPSNKDYNHYGERGIKVCDLWRNSFEAFYLAVGPKPAPEYTIERLDFNKGYEPGNVIWATRQVQNTNKGDNVKITIDNITQTVAEWSRDPRCSVSAYTLYKRINRGWLEKYGPEKTIFSTSNNEKYEYEE